MRHTYKISICANDCRCLHSCRGPCAHPHGACRWVRADSCAEPRGIPALCGPCCPCCPGRPTAGHRLCGEKRCSYKYKPVIGLVSTMGVLPAHPCVHPDGVLHVCWRENTPFVHVVLHVDHCVCRRTVSLMNRNRRTCIRTYPTAGWGSRGWRRGRGAAAKLASDSVQ